MMTDYAVAIFSVEPVLHEADFVDGWTVMVIFLFHHPALKIQFSGPTLIMQPYNQNVVVQVPGGIFEHSPSFVHTFTLRDVTFSRNGQFPRRFFYTRRTLRPRRPAPSKPCRTSFPNRHPSLKLCRCRCGRVLRTVFAYRDLYPRICIRAPV